MAAPDQLDGAARPARLAAPGAGAAASPPAGPAPAPTPSGIPAPDSTPAPATTKPLLSPHMHTHTHAHAPRAQPQLTPEQQRRREHERAEWERTRGAGTNVLALLDDTVWLRSHGLNPTLSGTTSLSVDQCTAADVLPTLQHIEAATASEPQDVPSADVLLDTGIGDYAILPKILGRGKFSTVFLSSKHGKLYAVKHTPLFPHHILIATRLLREPTLLAELPPHPNLVAVYETIRTPGHFYLVEEYLGGYVTLEKLLSMTSTTPPPALPTLPSSIASSVFTQLVSAVDAIHTPLQVCHRDIKPENILVHPQTLQLKLLDFGLATHFSKSEAKLSTCCGSPAFHCPEIVHALSSPLGAVTYWGPEVDAWTIGVTMLRVLTGVRYPLGASHTSLRSMAIRAQRALNLVADPDLRRRTGMLLDMDSIKRMQNFKQLVAEHEQAHGQPTRGSKDFKSSTFIPTTPTHRMKIPLVVDVHGEACLVPSLGSGLLGRAARTSSTLSLSQVLSSNSSLNVHTPLGSRSTSPNDIASQPPSPGEAPQHPMLILLNPDNEPPARVLSFIKYSLRCAGILYHGWPQSKPSTPNEPGAPAPLVDKALAELKDEALSESDATPTPSSATTHPPTGFDTSSTAKMRRHEEWAAVYVLECVLELPDPPPSSSGALSFVQSIMAAFGRRSSDSNTKQGIKRSSSTPASKESARPSSHTPPKASPGPSGKEGPIRCLKFYLVVRIPKLHHHHRSQQAHHQHSNALVPRVLDASSHPTRPKHTRSTSAYGARTQQAPPRTRTISFRPLLPAPQRSTLDLQMLPSGSAAWAVQPQPAPAPQQAPVAFVTAATGENDSLSLNPMTSPTGARRPLPSPGPSMPRSRTSSRTRPVGSRRRQHRVYVEITDLRAASAVVDALSLGGTQTQVQPPHETYRATETDVSTTDAEGNDTDSGAIRAAASVLGRKKGTPTATPRKKNKGASLSQTSSRASEELEHQRGRPREPKQGDARRNAERTVVPSPALDPPALSSVHFDVKALEAELGSAESELVQALRPHSEVEGTGAGALHLAEYRMQQLYESLERLDREAPTQLEHALGDRTFVIFAALTPALGGATYACQDASSKADSLGSAGPSALRTSSLKVLTAVARHSSPREVFVAVVERLETLASSEASCASKELPEDEHGVPTGPGCSFWEPALEIAGLLEILKTVLPRLQSKKPYKFTETLASTLPRATRRATTRLEAVSVTVSGLLVESVCDLCTSLAQWEADMRSSSTSERQTMAPSTLAIASATLANLYVTTVATLLSAWPHAGHLCQSYFCRPKTGPDSNFILASSVATQHTIVPGSVPQGDATMLAAAISEPAAALWEQVNHTTDSLHISLLTMALQPLEEDKEVDHSAARAARMAAFLLMVNLLARGYNVAGLGLPSSWTSTSAGHLLFESRAILMAALAPQGLNEAMPDAAIQWVLWALKAVGNEQNAVDSTTVLTLSQRLYIHLSTPLGRPARIALRDMLALQAGPLALDLLHDWCAPEEEGGAPALALALARDAASAQGHTGVLWSPAARDALLPPIEALIESALPPAPEAGASLEERQTAATYLIPSLAVRSGALTEAVQWVYYYLSADSNDSAGLRAVLPRLQGKVYAPLHNAVLGWKAALHGIEGGERVQAAMALDLLDLALARLLGGMEACATPVQSQPRSPALSPSPKHSTSHTPSWPPSEAELASGPDASGG